ncbi:hypothetical protein BDB00DRAFT_934098 [Zychaea mexicana]|uniref:uncharacterized protein n=1 Tax=Zychaea mexicana TaxID=64656 RepID=UPI0022FF2F36|nr:uncharacterized protein BDB00DRAFT_934098 [Zychaea mexicana]KAI9477142.1 hypothetical protein BDB00DRAFT_934098 [Zychaea mexicana]
MNRFTTDDHGRDRESDYTQLSSYSPQDSPTQAPTRHYDEDSYHPTRQERRQGSITGDESGGLSSHSHSKNRSIADMIEQRWKGKQIETKRQRQQPYGDDDQNNSQHPTQRPMFLSRPSMEPEERRESFVQKIEAAGQNVFRRSSSSTESLIDKLSETLNAWSTGIDGVSSPEQRGKKVSPEQQQSQHPPSGQEREQDQGRPISMSVKTAEQEEQHGESPLHNKFPLPAQSQSKSAEQRQQDRHSWPLSLLFNQQHYDQDQQQVQGSRRMSWSDRAFSFLFQHTMTGNKPFEWREQEDIEFQGSDVAYDEVQGMFKLWKFSAPATTPSSSAVSRSSKSPVSNAATAASSTPSSITTDRSKSKDHDNPYEHNAYQHEFPSPPKLRVRNESLPTGKQAIHHAEIIPPSSTRKGSIENWPSESYANVARRSMSHETTNGTKNKNGKNGNNIKNWFNADPESGRVKVPPLSVPGAPSEQSSKSLYDATGIIANTSKKNKSAYDPQSNKNKFHVVHHKKHPEEDQGIPDREPRFDSDFENWKPSPEGNTRRHTSHWPDSYQIKDENKHRASITKNVWVAQADAQHGFK